MMLNKTNPFAHIGYFILAGIFITGCSNYENPINSVSQGKFDIKYNIDMSVKDMSGKVYALPDSLTDVSGVRLIITDLATDVEHEWNDIREFTDMNSFRPGEYKVALKAESKTHKLIFSADTTVTLTGLRPTPVNLTLTPEAVWISNDFTTDSPYILNYIGYHSLKTGIVDSVSVHQADAFIRPGETEIYASFTNSKGETISLLQGKPLKFEKSRRYDFVAELTADNFNYKNTDAQLSSSVTLSEDLFDKSSPVITASGFADNVPVTAVEGVTLSEPVKVVIDSKIPMEHLYLTVESPMVNLLNGSTETFELDFLNLTSEEKEIISNSKLSISIGDDRKHAAIDFTKSIESLASRISAKSVFTLAAINSVGLVSQPVSLIVDTQAVAFKIEKVGNATVGLDIAHIILRPSTEAIEISDLSFETTDGVCCPILSSKKAEGLIELEVGIPGGISPIDLDLYFVGLKRSTLTVNRTIPEFAVFPDGYATSARLRVVSQDEKISKALTRMLNFKIDRSDVSVVERDTSDCIVVINGLKPENSYRLDAYLSPSVTLMTTKFSTEEAAPVPDGDFEDVDPLITFKNLPSGGRYALTSLDLINRQNFTDINVYWTKKNWASINSRTFCTDARNKNTWFMQPSAEVVWEGASGSKSMMVKSVGWDTNGPAIPDWVPEPGTGATRYSGAVPAVAHHSAGRLFLGKYSFNPTTMTEIYNEGVAFSSRPSSLNGFYKYSPDSGDPSDRGQVTIELVRRDATTNETVIASGEYIFGSCPDFKSFNVPLVYQRYDLHPTHLKIMFTSSIQADEVPIDDNNVPVTPNLEKGTYIGSTLWIDNLSFTY